MPRGGSPKRHAQAVFEIARGRNELERWQQDLGHLSELSQDPLFRVVMENPKLSIQGKLDLLQDKLSRLSPLATNLLALLVTRGRLRLAPQITNEYERLVNAHQGIERAEVITAIPLDETEMTSLVQHLDGIVRRKVVLTARVDPGIVGGMVVRIGDRLLDDSVRNRLQALKKSLIEVGR